MKSFYEAHYREPVFPYSVRLYLRLVHDQDVAVSLASATFSMLSVLLTYFMGAIAFSPWVGLLAALGMAVERDAIWWGVSGWRDDAFTCSVALCACLMLQVRRKPSTARSVQLGIAAALSCLIRIFSVSFLVPGFLYLLIGPREQRFVRARSVVVAAVTASLLVMPYLVNCWREYGDPLYTLNYQPLSYLGWEHVQTASPPGAVGYIGEKLMRAPFRTIDTALLGMTTYPYLNKWTGFDPWRPSLGKWLAALGLVGMVLFTVSNRGRLLLLVVASAQLPFAFTWQLSADWRYTEFTYPFFLIAAALTIVTVVRAGRPSWWKQSLVHPVAVPALKTVTLVLVTIGAVAWGLTSMAPVLVFREALKIDGSAVIEAGHRDRAFFGEGWSRDPVRVGNVTARVADGARSVVDVPVPVPASGGYAVTVRIDPFPPPADGDVLPTVFIFANGTLIRKAPLTWDLEKVGSYDFVLPASVIRRGGTRLAFVTDNSLDPAGRGQPTRSGHRFKLWYVLVKSL